MARPMRRTEKANACVKMFSSNNSQQHTVRMRHTKWMGRWCGWDGMYTDSCLLLLSSLLRAGVLDSWWRFLVGIVQQNVSIIMNGNIVESSQHNVCSFTVRLLFTKKIIIFRSFDFVFGLHIEHNTTLVDVRQIRKSHSLIDISYFIEKKKTLFFFIVQFIFVVRPLLNIFVRDCFIVYSFCSRATCVWIKIRLKLIQRKQSTVRNNTLKKREKKTHTENIELITYDSCGHIW